MVADLTIRPSRFEIVVSPNRSSNDHQARILVDGADWLGADVLGLDPPDLAAELLGKASNIRIGRCSCGAPGCDDRDVGRLELPEVVTWLSYGRTLRFDGAQYRAEIERFVADQSWRPVERQAELAVDAIFAGTVLEGRLHFQWSSARIGRGLVHLSFFGEGEQRLLEFSWDGETVQSAVDRAHLFLRERFED